ncbi:hypothetical protein CDL12_15904 [Handroanthus impetiginosus]|uniref:Uncharacterized protein n=1 Tax=Handroanthus impetiginosus TaxID=429701 RepID=A0A2G9H1Y0_9LAMI|nr:hypothetical protein CDL12_15904 [Handroanthus impetiginosus]
MACGSVFKAFFLTQPEPWLPFPFVSGKRSTFMPITFPHNKISTQNQNCGCKLTANVKSHQFVRNCLSNGKPSSSREDSEQDPPQEAVLKAISVQVSSSHQVISSFNLFCCCYFTYSHVY